MDGVFFITLGIAQQEIGKVVPFGIRRRSCEAAVEVEVSLSKSKIVLDFLVKRPTEPKFELVCALRPGKVVAQLVIVRRVYPRLPTRSVVRSSSPIQVDRWDALVDIGPGEQPVEGKARGSRDQALRDDVDPVAVIVERRFVEQRRTNHVRGMNHRAIGGVPESIEN